MCVCVSVCKCKCERVLCRYGADVCAVDFQLKHGGFDPRRVRSHTPFFSFLFYLIGGYQHPNVYV